MNSPVDNWYNRYVTKVNFLTIYCGNYIAVDNISFEEEE